MPRTVMELVMNRRLIALPMLLLACAGCEDHVVRFNPESAPTADGDGLHFSLKKFRRDAISVQAWLSVTNHSAAPLTMRTPPGKPFWATARGGDQPATVKAMRWIDTRDHDDMGGMTPVDLPGPWPIPAQSTVELELILTVPHPLASSHEPWTATLYLPDQTSVDIPLVDPQAAGASTVDRPH
jgi:hypothetical protein